MSIDSVNRRHFLTLTLASLLAPGRLAAELLVQTEAFTAEVGILYQMLSFRLRGDVQERVDQAGGQYDVRVNGRGSDIASRIESTGVWREGRWWPLRNASWFRVHGRESRVQVAYDYGRRVAEYHARGETFLMRRLRIVDDVVALPDGASIDDAISASLNFRDGNWAPNEAGRLHTRVVRRRRSENEGPDDVAKTYRAELVPLELKLEPEPETRRPSALLDLSRFSSWARESRPARIVFDDKRRPELITGSMILGTSVTIRLG
jgi:hypothetical protein